MTIISLGIGQGEIGITPLQLANLAATISNRGWYYVAHIIRAVGKKDSLNPGFREKKFTDVNKAYFDIVVEGMADVVTSGTARSSHIDSLDFCGKTGTAQNPHGKNHSIFIAFAPKLNSKIAIAVVVENAGYGAEWAAPIASLMLEKYLRGTVKRKDMEERFMNADLIHGINVKNESGKGHLLPD